MKVLRLCVWLSELDHYGVLCWCCELFQICTGLFFTTYHSGGKVDKVIHKNNLVYVKGKIAPYFTWDELSTGNKVCCPMLKSNILLTRLSTLTSSPYTHCLTIIMSPHFLLFWHCNYYSCYSDGQKHLLKRLMPFFKGGQYVQICTLFCFISK